MKSGAKEYIKAFYYKNRLPYVLAVIFYLGDVLVYLLDSWMLGAVLDAVSAVDREGLIKLLYIAAAVSVAMFADNLLLQFTKSSFVCRGITQYRSMAFSKLTRKNISAFARENTASYLSALTNDAKSIEADYLERTLTIIRLLMMLVGTLIMMFWYSWKLSVATIAMSMLPLLVSVLMGREMTNRERALSDCNGEFVAKVKDLLSGFGVIKSFRAEEQSIQLFEEANGKLNETKLRRRRWSGLLSTSGECSGLVMQFGIFFLCGFFAIQGEISPGTVIIFVNLSNFVIQPIQYVPELWGARKAALGLVDKLAELNEQNISHGGEAVDSELKNSIELKGLNFGYEENKPILKDVSLCFEPGKAYALVGTSGSGKSTLLRLLMGGYDSYNGSLTVDGQEMRNIDPDSLYDLMCLVGQEVFIFDDTIRNNITMFGSFSNEEVDAAAEKAGLDTVIKERGEDYRCGENGVNLSGGERQRISIARSLLRGNTVLMADEATAALDAETAKHVTGSILDLNGITRIVVTHRIEPSVLSRYDKIIVMKNGRICEQGGFDQLMEAKKQFYALYTVANG